MQYGSATGLFGSSATNFFVFPAGTFIQPCKYILVGMTTGANGSPLPVTPDFTTGINMSSSAGKVAIINISTGGNACTGNTTGGIFVDVLGYGSTATCYETAQAAGQTSSGASIRGSNGQLDTDNNSTDFSTLTPTTVRNSASPANIACLATPTMSKTWGAIKTIYR